MSSLGANPWLRYCRIGCQEQFLGQRHWVDIAIICGESHYFSRTVESLLSVGGERPIGSLDYGTIMTMEAKRAATLVLIRNGEGDLEVLLLRRHKQLRVGGGSWVFPGGSIDEVDGPLGDAEQATAMRAAIRETREESGLEVPEQSLQLLSHWTTPSGYPFRFATWFFLAEADATPVQVDGEEMDDFCWSSPAQLLARHQCGEMTMLPPTVVTLTELSQCSSVAQAKDFYASREAPFIEPRRAEESDPLCMMYPGDAGYEATNADAVGARNRCYLESGVWRYEFLMGAAEV